MPNGDEGQWLIDHRVELERGEAAWLERLAEFDATGGWYGDGQLSCVDWLVWFVKMGRSTAFEKVRVARQLRRRPIIAEAFRTGRISYSAARTITRAEDPDEDVDQALVTVAESGSPADVERAVRTYQAYRDQDLPPAELVRQRRGIRLHPTGDGLVRVEGFLTELEAAELSAALALTIDREDHQPATLPTESPVRDSPAAEAEEDCRAEEDEASSLSQEPAAEEPAESPGGDWWDQHAAAGSATGGPGG